MAGYALYAPKPELTFGELQTLTAGTALYQSKPDPELILRRGLIEEVQESTQLDEEASASQALYDREGELGDVLWYVSEVSSFTGNLPQGVRPQTRLDAFQSTVDGLLVPIQDQHGEVLSPKEDAISALAITALRVVDVLNPKDKALWVGQSERASMDVVLRDLLAAVSIAGTQEKTEAGAIQLSAAVNHSMHKLSTRPRKPHVINEPVNKDIAISSQRGRAWAVSDWTRMLWVSTLNANSELWLKHDLY